ncbi:HD domain-containing protein, partial [Patescibacteria group bacterium]|nr:HD domain-containing protein [Patescibacteria group bacterium]
NDISQQVNNTWRHSTIVWKFANDIAQQAIKNGYIVDRKLLKVGCYVHDMGRMVTGSKGSKIMMHPIYHLYEGYRILKKRGFPVLARICICHAGGGGLDKITNKKHGFMARDFFPRTMEEKIIAYADARASYRKGQGPYIGSYAKAYNRFRRYRGHGKRLSQAHKFVKEITANKKI